MGYKLFIDDERQPISNDWVIVRDCASAQEVVKARGIPYMISFDHDLGVGPTGFDFAKWLGDYILDLGDQFVIADFSYAVHSQNPIGAANIRGYLDGLIQFIGGA